MVSNNPDGRPNAGTPEEIRKRLTDNGFPEIVELLPLTAGLGDIDLSPCEKQILAVKLYAGTEELLVVEKCALAQVSRKSWYNAHHSDIFKGACVKLTKAKIAANIPEIFNRYQTLAISSRTDDARRQEKLLIEAGVFERNNINVAANFTVNVEIAAQQRADLQRQGGIAFGFLPPDFVLKQPQKVVDPSQNGDR